MQEERLEKVDLSVGKRRCEQAVEPSWSRMRRPDDAHVRVCAKNVREARHRLGVELGVGVQEEDVRAVAIVPAHVAGAREAEVFVLREKTQRKIG